MEKKTIMEVIKENKGAIIKRALIIVGSVGAVLAAAKLLHGDQEEIMIPVPNELDSEPSTEVNPEEASQE